MFKKAPEVEMRDRRTWAIVGALAIDVVALILAVAGVIGIIPFAVSLAVSGAITRLLLSFSAGPGGSATPPES